MNKKSVAKVVAGLLGGVLICLFLIWLIGNIEEYRRKHSPEYAYEQFFPPYIEEAGTFFAENRDALAVIAEYSEGLGEGEFYWISADGPEIDESSSEGLEIPDDMASFLYEFAACVEHIYINEKNDSAYVCIATGDFQGFDWFSVGLYHGEYTPDRWTKTIALENGWLILTEYMLRG